MKIVKSRDTYTFYKSLEILDKLEPVNYFIRQSMFGLYLQEAPPFHLPDPLFDVEGDLRDLVLKSFTANDKNIGVLLEGYKGQGKTVTSKLLAMESGLPIIIIDAPIARNVDFISFLNDIEQPICVFVDEFEKIFHSQYVYNEDGDSDGSGGHGPGNAFHSQNSFLTIMDGALSTKYKKLFIFTSNDPINDKFMNRPSRVMWHKSYNHMSKKLFDMILDKALENQDFREDLIEHLPLQEATVDLLMSIINQVNLLHRPYSVFKKIFNHHARSIDYEVTAIINKKSYDLGRQTASSHPILGTKYFNGINIDKMLELGEEICVFESSAIHNRLYAMATAKVIDAQEMKERPILYQYKKVKTFETTLVI